VFELGREWFGREWFDHEWSNDGRKCDPYFDERWWGDGEFGFRGGCYEHASVWRKCDNVDINFKRYFFSNGGLRRLREGSVSASEQLSLKFDFERLLRLMCGKRASLSGVVFLTRCE
jgi:hypothetical protein